MPSAPMTVFFTLCQRREAVVLLQQLLIFVRMRALNAKQKILCLKVLQMNSYLGHYSGRCDKRGVKRRDDITEKARTAASK